MVIPYNEVPFQLSFKLTFRTWEKVVPAGEFYTSKDDLYKYGKNSPIEIPENVPLELSFFSEDLSARFYMDGLDTLPDRLLEEDKEGGEVFLISSLAPVVIYEMNGTNNYPYIPGIYQIKVNVNGTLFFTWIKIIPKQMSEDQWEFMKDEVENELQGLAQDFVQKSYGLISQNSSQLSPVILRQFMIIEHRFPAIMAAITDLYRKLNYSIKKEYHFVPKEKLRVIDELTIRHRVQHPESEHLIKTPSKITNYDLPENRFVKRIVKSIVSKLSQFIVSVEAYQEQLSFELEELHLANFSQNQNVNQKTKIIEALQQYLEKAAKMRGAFNLIKTAPWYGKISDIQNSSIPHKMTTDVRYRTLYLVQQELQKESIDISFDKNYSYQWKRTDKLYEMWGFLQFVKLLQHDELGFKPVSGWLYDQDAIIENIIIPTIPSGTTITFEKEDINIKLIYDGKLPSQSEGTNSENFPLYTNGTNNTPDGRLDFYQNKIYIGSLLFDMKYRPKHSIWDQTLVQTNVQTKTMKQLVSYAFNCRSQHLFASNLSEYLRDSVRPVSEVWALYPNRHGNSESKFYKDHGVRLVELTPTMDNNHLIQELDHIITYFIERNKSVLV
jgi:hypothetical protein